jgi:hypothetical protein
MVRVLASFVGVLVAGALTLLVGTPAGAQSSSACSQIESTLTSIQKELPQASSSALASKIGAFVAQLETESASAPASVKSAVGAFVTDLKAAASGKINVAKLTADANAIGTACTASAPATAPTGAPQTGAGSTAGLQDASFVYGGAALVAAGGVVTGFGIRRRRRARTSY